MTEQLRSYLETTSSAYKAQFDTPPSLPLSWSVDASTGSLMLDGVWLCPADLVEPELEAGEVNAECMSLRLQDGFLDIYIEWPFKGQPRIDKIVHGVRNITKAEDLASIARQVHSELSALLEMLDNDVSDDAPQEEVDKIRSILLKLAERF